MLDTLDEHYGYLADRIKIEKYRKTIEQLVRPEHVVLDLGCGTGVLGLMALRAGARKVLFVEEKSVIEVARRAVAEAGFSDQAEFFRANSLELSLPQKVDLIVCDHVGYFGFDYEIFAVLADAKRRFLKPGGMIVPASIDVMLAPVQSDSCRNLIEQWHDGTVPEDFGWLGRIAANRKHGVEIVPEDLLAESATLATLEMGAEAPGYLSWNAEFVCTKKGKLDGVVGWFHCRLTDSELMTNAPGVADRLDRPQAFLPLESPVHVSEGELVRITVMARHLDNVIGWVVELPGSGLQFSQSTFNGLLVDQEALARARPDRIAKLNDRGRARQIVLSYCDGRRTIEQVQTLVERDHPALFPTKQSTTSFIIRVLAEDTSA
jgi:protein arginine N-methyltransferase 1